MKSVPQIENDRLDIHDKDPSTEGGPPGWLAFVVVFLGGFLAAVLAMAVLYLMTR